MPIIRVLLNSEDLRKIRLLPSVDPIEELISAAHEYSTRRADPVWASWVRQTFSAMGPAFTPVMHVMNSGYVQVCGWPSGETAGRSFDDALEAVLSAPLASWRSSVDDVAGFGVDVGPAAAIADGQRDAIVHYGRVLRRFHEAAIAPYWPKLSLRVSAARDACMRLLAVGGVDRLLNGLHPAVSWEPPWLTIRKKPHKPNCPHTTIRRLDGPVGIVQGLGRGLNLSPSVFAEQPSVKPACNEDDLPVQLDFPIPVDWQSLSDPAADVRRDPLADLMGATRSSVLQALGEHQHTTTSLAKALHLSTASASEHAAVLRAANLVTTTREGNHVTHELSALGATLVYSMGL